MYVSDYSYAAISSAWSTTLNNYKNIKDNNWMYMGNTDWPISRLSVNSNNVFAVGINGGVNSHYVFGNSGVRPTFSLETSVTYVSGGGTQNSPIRIN